MINTICAICIIILCNQIRLNKEIDKNHKILSEIIEKLDKIYENQNIDFEDIKDSIGCIDELLDGPARRLQEELDEDNIPLDAHSILEERKKRKN